MYVYEPKLTLHIFIFRSLLRWFSNSSQPPLIFSLALNALATYKSPNVIYIHLFTATFECKLVHLCLFLSTPDTELLLEIQWGETKYFDGAKHPQVPADPPLPRRYIVGTCVAFELCSLHKQWG